MQCLDSPGAPLRSEPLQQHLAEQVMVAVPGALPIQWHQEQVRFRYLLQQRLARCTVSAPAQERIVERGRESVADGGREEKLLHRRRLEGKDLLQQVGLRMRAALRQRLEVRQAIRQLPQGQRGQAKSNNPTLGPLVEGGDPAAAAEILLGNFEQAGDGTVQSRLPMTQHMEIARRLYELDSYELMARIECQVLFLPALSGPWPRDEKARGLQRAQDVLGRRAQITWVDGGHDLPVQRPGEVAKAMADFVGQLGSGERG